MQFRTQIPCHRNHRKNIIQRLVWRAPAVDVSRCHSTAVFKAPPNTGRMAGVGVCRRRKVPRHLFLKAASICLTQENPKQSRCEKLKLFQIGSRLEPPANQTGSGCFYSTGLGMHDTQGNISPCDSWFQPFPGKGTKWRDTLSLQIWTIWYTVIWYDMIYQIITIYNT